MLRVRPKLEVQIILKTLLNITYMERPGIELIDYKIALKTNPINTVMLISLMDLFLSNNLHIC